jgi:hypothetical protein
MRLSICWRWRGQFPCWASAEGERTHVTRRDTTTSILVLLRTKIPWANEPGVACKVDIMPKTADHAWGLKTRW